MTTPAYRSGSQFRITRLGCRLMGLRAVPGGYKIWEKLLTTGEIIECLGPSASLGDGPTIIKWRAVEQSGAEIVDCEFTPSVGPEWKLQPDPDYLEQIA